MIELVSAFRTLPRISWAMLISVLVHAGIIVFPTQAPSPPVQVVFASGSLSMEVRIARVSENKTGTRDIYLTKDSPSWRGPPDKTLKPAKKSDSAQTKEKENTAPVKSDESEATRLPAGVSLKQTLYTSPLPRSFAESVGDYVKEAELDEKPAAIRIAVPQYPPEAVDSGAGGWILVALLLDEKGAVVSARAIGSNEPMSAYRNFVADTMRHSAFSPGKRNGTPVRTLIFQTVYFDPKAYASAQSETAGSKPAASAEHKRNDVQ